MQKYDIDKLEIIETKETTKENNNILPPNKLENTNDYILVYQREEKKVHLFYTDEHSFYFSGATIWFEPSDQHPVQESFRVIYSNRCGDWGTNRYINGTFGFNKITNINISEGLRKKFESYTGAQPTYGEKEKHYNEWAPQCKVEVPKPPQPPTPGGGGEQNNGGQTDKPCSNTGQFGGGGTPLKDIKLFLYANKVTKGAIKLSKPQVEVGTFATDWRPNPSDYVHVNNSNFKRINGIAMQHSDVSGKTFLEIQAKDGTVFGIDTWGGTQKLLEQQQAEIEELKKLVQTLETKINV